MEIDARIIGCYKRNYSNIKETKSQTEKLSEYNDGDSEPTFGASNSLQITWPILKDKYQALVEFLPPLETFKA